MTDPRITDAQVKIDRLNMVAIAEQRNDAWAEIARLRADLDSVEEERIHVGSRGREIAGGWVSRAAVLRIIEGETP